MVIAVGPAIVAMYGTPSKPMVNVRTVRKIGVIRHVYHAVNGHRTTSGTNCSESNTVSSGMDTSLLISSTLSRTHMIYSRLYSNKNQVVH